MYKVQVTFKSIEERQGLFNGFSQFPIYRSGVHLFLDTCKY